jgi:outer membrane murein-binding lipoprotein Lpp
MGHECHFGDHHGCWPEHTCGKGLSSLVQELQAENDRLASENSRLRETNTALAGRNVLLNSQMAAQRQKLARIHAETGP